MHQDRWADLNGVRLHCDEWPGDGQTILCIHGLTGNGRCWDALAERLSPQQRVIAPDLRGRGQSDKPEAGPYGLSAHVQDMSALIRSLDCGPVAVVGHSMGAFVAAQLAERHPDLVSRLILMDGGGLGEEMSPEGVKAQIQSSLSRLSTVFPSYAAYVGFWQRMPFLQPWNEYFERFLAADVQVRDDGTVVSRTLPGAIAEDMTQNLHAYDMAVTLPAVRVTTLVLQAPVGVVNPAEPLWPRSVAERTTALISGARLVAVAGANHYSILYAPEAMGAVVEAVAG